MDRPTSWGPLFVSPLRFWLGAAAFLLVVGGMAYGYGAWYAGVLLQDAVAVREVAANSSWTAQFQYEEVDGIRRRVELPGPEGLGTAVEVDDLTAADPASAGYATYGAVLKELGAEKDDEEKKKEEEEGRGLSREELLRTLRQAGVMLNEVDTSSWRETVEIGSGLSADEARQRAEEFRKTGRDVEVETYRDPSGATRYRLNYGRVRTEQEAAALKRELQEAGLVAGGGTGAGGAGADTGGGGEDNGAGAGGGTTSNGGTPSGADNGGETGGGSSDTGGGGETPPPAQPGGGRSVTDL